MRLSSREWVLIVIEVWWRGRASVGDASDRAFRICCSLWRRLPAEDRSFLN